MVLSSGKNAETLGIKRKNGKGSKALSCDKGRIGNMCSSCNQIGTLYREREIKAYEIRNNRIKT